MRTILKGSSLQWFKPLVLVILFCYGQANILPAILRFQPKVPESVARALNEGRNLRKLNRLAEASRSFQQAADEAGHEGRPALQAEALVLKSGCDIRLFQYAAALRATQQARLLAIKANDHTFAGAADTNLSTVYSQLGDFAAARTSAAEAVEFLASSPRKDYYLRALMIQGEIEFGLHQTVLGSASFRHAIAIAKEANLPQYEALASDHLGTWLLLAGDLANAETAILYAQKIFEKLKDSDGLAGSYEHLAELESRKGGVFLRSALAHIDLAFATQSQAFKTSPQYYPIHIRGQILLSLGQRYKALAEFKRSVETADSWRQSALPGDTTSIQTVAQLDSVYQDYAELAAEISLEYHDRELSREAFEVLARNRAASLREQLTRSYSGKLLENPEYFNLLQQLQSAQASTTLESDSRQSDVQRQKLNQIRARLSNLENQIGLNQQNFLQPSEKKSPRNLLKGIQARLRPSEALLSFSLGDRKSFLWTVTSDDVRLYELPRRQIIAQQAQAFSEAVSTNSPTRVDAGSVLFRTLFSKVGRPLQHKGDWLLTPDGALLDKVPFAALPDLFQGSKPLISTHTLRILPSAMLLQKAMTSEAGGGFIGVADPIYNLADPRREHTGKPRTKSSSTVVGLGRLPASEIEIKTSAAQCGLPQTTMLTGKDASSVSLRQVVQRKPEILHFAVHVISPKDFPQEAALALSLTKDNLPELLTAEAVATYHVPGSLVVLSGCASQQGEVLPGAGLVGLSRGWLLAGAAAVVVSAWPTPDASGSFFPTFYAHYRQTSGSIGERSAKALQQTQIDMQRSGGYQSEPKFWAAYSIISKE